MPTLQLSPNERSALRARAHALKPVVIVAGAGLTIAVVREVDLSLKAHELIKVRANSEERELREAWLNQLCEELNAAPIQHLGKILVLFRPKPEVESAAKPKPKPRTASKSRSAAPGKLKVSETGKAGKARFGTNKPKPAVRNRGVGADTMKKRGSAPSK